LGIHTMGAEMMPERGWWTLTVKKNIADIIKGAAEHEGLTVSEYLERLVREHAKSIAAAKVKTLESFDSQEK